MSKIILSIEEAQNNYFNFSGTDRDTPYHIIIKQINFDFYTKQLDYEIQEIRRIRQQISAENGNNLKAVAKYCGVSRGKYPHNGRPAHYAFAQTCQMNGPGCPVSADFCEQKFTLSPMALRCLHSKECPATGDYSPPSSTLLGSQRRIAFRIYG